MTDTDTGELKELASLIHFHALHWQYDGLENPLGHRDADAIKAGHEAIRDIDRLIARLHKVRAGLVSELRQDEDIRVARPLPGRCGDHHASGTTNCTREPGHTGAHHNGSGLTWGGVQ